MLTNLLPRSTYIYNRLISIRGFTAQIKLNVQDDTSLSEDTREPKTIKSEPAIPLPQENENNFSPKIINLVNQISQLNLIEVADLSKLLKKTLNIPDNPTFSAMPFSMAKAASEEPAEPIITKTSFNVKLVKFDESKKIGLIKEIKGIVPGLNLVQAKKFVETLPQIVTSNLGKDEAEKLKAQLTALGATVEIE